MDTRKLIRDLQTVKREKTPRFREPFKFRHGATQLCESKQHYEYLETFCEALDTEAIVPEDFSIRELFEECVPDGRELARYCDPRDASGTQALIEAAGGIAASDFSNISGQIVYTRLIEKMNLEEFKITKLIPSQSTPFDGEKIAGIDGLGDQAAIVGELQDYPIIATSEDWIETPQTTKRGFIVPVSKEAIFFDRTGKLLNEAGKVGEWLGVNKEKRAIDCLINENTNIHRYTWRGTAYDTYQTSTPWINAKATQDLVDWTDIQEALIILGAITDPSTAEPVVVEPTTLICDKSLEPIARRILNATDIHYHVGGYATSGNLGETVFPNPYKSAFNLVTSRFMAGRLSTASYWFLGNPQVAFAYMENWPIQVIRLDEGPAMFHRDIVTQFRCSERGQYTTIEPRVMYQGQGT